jgi:hypothetical protein
LCILVEFEGLKINIGVFLFFTFYCQYMEMLTSALHQVMKNIISLNCHVFVALLTHIFRLQNWLLRMLKHYTLWFCILV